MRDIGKVVAGGADEARSPMKRLPAACLAFFAVLFPSGARGDANAAPPDPCAGMLALIDRPTVADSPCSVRPRASDYEVGFTNQISDGGSPGKSSAYPQAELRFGLPHGIELKLFPPSRVWQSVAASGVNQISSGTGDSGFGVKYQIGYSARWIVSTDAILTLPTGTNGFSSGGPSETLKGIAGYSLSPTVGLSANVAIASQAGSRTDGTLARFRSVNTTLVMSDLLSDRLQAYGEVYGASAAAPGQGGRYAADGGLQYLLAPSFEVDMEVGAGLGPSPAARTHLFGFGFGVEL